jgi:Tol biopolymer transport system component
MTLAAGTRLGAYDVLALIGAGGMGEVYRAKDSKLHRDVALKVLPDLWASDPDRLARFQREAHVLASLNHPHIAAIYGFEDIAGVRALVLELVEGETLADRMTHGPIPLEETLQMARQIAEALEAAHEVGVVHRDLKPANIKVRPDSSVKVLDFGLAKAMAGDSAVGHVSLSPTITSPAMMTGAGVILGTAAYMAPEQAKGKAADARSDIWAFGVILYEMLTGRSAFGGETSVEILGSVLNTDPDWTALPATTPTLVRSLLRRCLQRDRSRRLRDIADARFQIEEALNEPGATGRAATIAPARTGRERLLWMAAVFAGAVAASLMTAVYLRRAPADAPEMRLQIVTPPGASLMSFSVSPDGRSVVFQATAEGKSQLWLRPLASETAEPLPGTENGTLPFWSPDGQSIGFFAGRQLKRSDITGGLVRTLASSPNDRGGTWNDEGVILFAPSSTGPLYRVPVGGGSAVEVTRVDAPRHSGHRFPRFLPDGRHFLFFALGTPESQGVYLGSLDSMEARRLFEADGAAVFVPPDLALFPRQGALWAQRLDPDTFEPVGDSLPVAKSVAVDSNLFANVALSASSAGVVAYRASGVQGQLTWFDRSGRQIGTVGGRDMDQPADFRLSPDGRSVSFRRAISGNVDVWLMEVARGVLRRFTSDGAREYEAIWSPDGSRIAFSSDRQGVLDLYEKPVAGAGAESLLLASPEHKNIYDWSFDGRFILYASQNPKTGEDLWALPLDGDRKPLPVAQTAFQEVDGRFSPDGRWIAYMLNESGRNEIHVQPFPGPGAKLQISTNGGSNPQWRRDGREIFFLGPDNRLMAVPVMLAANGSTVEAGTPVALFATRPGSEFAASPDGQRFLINTSLEDAAIPPITVLLNWKPRP